MTFLHQCIEAVSVTALFSLVCLGCFSRFTKGRWTPRFHAYQLERAPTTGAGLIIPFMDALMATLIAIDKTRNIALLLCTIFQGLALVQRLAERKESVPDALICALSATAYLSATRRGT
jgi:hypothetical protein